MESEPGDGNLSYTSVVAKRFLPDLYVDSDLARKNDWGRDPDLKPSMLRLDTKEVPHDVSGYRGMSRDVDTTNSRTREEPVPGPDRSFHKRQCLVRHPHSYTHRHAVTLPSLEALRVERQRGRVLDRFLASFKMDLKTRKESDMPGVSTDGSRRSTRFTGNEGREHKKSVGSRGSTRFRGSEKREHKKSLTPFKWTIELKTSIRDSIAAPKTKRDSAPCESDDETNSQSLLRKLWKKAIRIVLIVIRMGNQMAHWSMILEHKSFPTFTDLGEGEYEELHEILFPKERTKRKVIKEDMLSKTAQMIMSLPPQTRTKEDRETVLYSLQTIEKFRRFPLDIQEDIVSCGHLMVIKNKRVLIRQGHEAVNWYFVVCGQGVVSSNVVATRQKRIVTILSQGMSFGETAINRKIPRACTVVSRTPMQLIYLTNWDYLQIFKETLEMFPEHIKFIRNLNFMKNWPIEHLLKHPSQCTQSYYRKKEMIVEDSSNSNFLYIVRSGRCAACILVPRTFTSWRDLQQKLIHPMIDIEGTWPEARTDTGNEPRGSYSRYKRASSFSMESTHLASMSCLQLFKPDYYRQLPSSRPSHPCNAVGKHDWPFDFMPKSKDGKMADRDESSGNGEEKKKEQGREKEMKGKEGEKHSYFHQEAADRAINSPSPTADENEKFCLHVARKLQLPSLFKTTSTTTGKWRRRSYSVSKDCVYLLVDTLKAGDVFGLDELDLPDMKEFVQAGKPCLVSMGAEVIALCKKFYMSHCNTLCQREVFKGRRFYPTQENMHLCYRLHLAWQQYTSKVVDELNEDLLKKGRRFFGLYFSSEEMIPDTTLSKSDGMQRRLKAASELSELRFWGSKK